MHGSLKNGRVTNTSTITTASENTLLSSPAQHTPAANFPTADQHTLAVVEFNHSGSRKLRKISHSLGSNPIRCQLAEEIVLDEMSAYLAGHEAAGIHLDGECLEVRYDEGIYLLLKKMQGIWYITDCTIDHEVLECEEYGAFVQFKPLFVWQTIKRGLDYIIAHVLVGWKMLIEKACGERSSAFATHDITAHKGVKA